MANQVYANGMEIACKAASGKSVAAFPDTCLSPPSPPAGPQPLPYPNTAFASDTTDGTTTVMISGQEIMMKDQSTFKKSTGDEAATKSLGMGVVTHTIQGEASFVAWSMDVKFEGANADRHLDMMLHNEQSNPANTATWNYCDAMVAAFAAGGKCENMEHLRLQQKREPCPTKNGEPQHGHHLLPARCFYNADPEIPNYDYDMAPVICVTGRTQHMGAHKLCHDWFDSVELGYHENGWDFTYSAASSAATGSAGQALDPPRPLTPKERDCVQFQQDQYYKAQPPQGLGMSDNTKLGATGARGKHFE